MTWEEFDKEMTKLSEKIIDIPDSVVGIVRGGIIPARLLCTKLNVKNMYCLTIKKTGEQRNITTDILEDLTGKKILLVEDILETGKSLEVAREYLEQKGAIVKTACLYTLSTNQIAPDYSLKEIKDVLKLPWE